MHPHTHTHTRSLYLEITNCVSGLTSKGRHLQFTRVAFSHGCKWFVAGDQQGRLYLFDLFRNRFNLLYKAGQSCTALTCCVSRPNEILMALADYTLRCIDVGECPHTLTYRQYCMLYIVTCSHPPDSGGVVAVLRGHEACVKSLSLDSSGRHLLAVSSRDSVLWDLDSFTKVSCVQ